MLPGVLHLLTPNRRHPHMVDECWILRETVYKTIPIGLVLHLPKRWAKHFGVPMHGVQLEGSELVQKPSIGERMWVFVATLFTNELVKLAERGVEVHVKD